MSLLGLWVSLLENSDRITQSFSPLPTHTRAASNRAQFPDQFSSLRNGVFHFAGVLAPRCQPALSFWLRCLITIPVCPFVPSLCWPWQYSRNFPVLGYWSPFLCLLILFSLPLTVSLKQCSLFHLCDMNSPCELIASFRTFPCAFIAVDVRKLTFLNVFNTAACT